MGFVPQQKPINARGDAMSRIVSDIVPVKTRFINSFSIRTLEASGSCGMAKNTVYRFLNSVHTNWRRFILLLSSRVISQELEPLTGAANMKVLIADDTLYRRNRSKHVELLSRVFDHTDHRYYRGFRMLILGWSDGISFLPVSCALLASSKEKNRLVPLRTDLDRRTNGARRRREGIRKATDVSVEMVAEAFAGGIQASHLLFDSWFAFPAAMRKLLAKGVHTISMLFSML